MSKADKQANRSALKASHWNHMPDRLRLVTPTPAAASWWTAGAAPDADATFTELARERDRHPWSNIVPHAMNPRGEFQ